jgi:ATP-dependent DNA ligase
MHLVEKDVKVFTRRDNDWTKRFRKIADDASCIPAVSAIIDGEVVVPAEDGTTDFSVLQNELRGRSRNIVLVAFDLLYLNGHDLRRLPLHQRKDALKTLIGGTLFNSARALPSTVARYSLTPVKSGSRASFQRWPTEPIQPVSAAAIWSRKPVHSATHW